jgi:hypothetical protein
MPSASMLQAAAEAAEAREAIEEEYERLRLKAKPTVAERVRASELGQELFEARRAERQALEAAGVRTPGPSVQEG